MASSGLDERGEPIYDTEDDTESSETYSLGLDRPAAHSEDLTMDIHLLHEKYEDKPINQVPYGVIIRLLDELDIHLGVHDALKRMGFWNIDMWNRGKRRRLQTKARAAVDEEKMRSVLNTLAKNSNSISEGWVGVLEKWLAT